MKLDSRALKQLAAARLRDAAQDDIECSSGESAVILRRIATRIRKSRRPGREIIEAQRLFAARLMANTDFSEIRRAAADVFRILDRVLEENKP